MTRHGGPGCAEECDECAESRAVTRLRREGWTPCESRCGRLLPPGSTGDVCAECQPCETCAGEGVYERANDDTGAECYCQDCDAGLDGMFASGEPWFKTLYPKAHADWVKRMAATNREAA